MIVVKKLLTVFLFVIYTIWVSFMTYHFSVKYFVANTQNLSVYKGYIGNNVEGNYYIFDKIQNLKDIKILKEIVVKQDNSDCEKNPVNKMWYYLYTNHSLNKYGFDDVLTMERWSTYAYEFDIDDDGEQEIIGWNNSCNYFGLIGGTGYIIKKFGDEYKEYAVIPLSARLEKLFILEDKTNGLHDIAISFVGLESGKVVVQKYEIAEK